MNNIVSFNDQKFELNLFLKDLSNAFIDTRNEVPIIITISSICCVAFLALGHMIRDLEAYHESNVAGKYEVYLGFTGILTLGMFAISLKKSYEKARGDRIIEAFKSQRTSFPDNTLPNMLVLTAMFDPNGALGNPLNQEKFLKLEKKFNIVFKKVSVISDINENLEKNSILKTIDVLWIDAHGSPSSIALSKPEGSKLRELTTSDLIEVADQIKTSLSPQGIIILDSCDTAMKPDEYSESFASALSSLSHRKVVAANQAVDATEIHTMDPLEIKFFTIICEVKFLTIGWWGSFQDCTVVINPSKKEKAELTLNM